MKKVTDHRVGDFRVAMYECSLGYTYKVFYGRTCVDRSYCYFLYKKDCYEKMEQALDNILGMKQTLKDMFGD